MSADRSTTPDRKEAPHVRAAFINAIADEGTKDEAIRWLQKTWNELCQAESELRKLRSDMERAQHNHAADLTFAASTPNSETAAGTEPVAWRYRYSGLESWKYVESEREINPHFQYEREALYASSPSSATHARVIEWPKIRAMLAEAGYDASQVHPVCYVKFSYTTFLKLLGIEIGRADSEAVKK